jgi:hypothetical protein
MGDAVKSAVCGRRVVIYQYGRSKPSTDEDQAFLNWFKDTFGVKRSVTQRKMD